MENEKVFAMPFGKVYPLLVAKAVRKGRTKAEVDEIIGRLTGYAPEKLDAMAQTALTYGDFFREAPAMHPNRDKITGSICGVRIESIEDPLMRELRILDKLIDELAKGKPMEKILAKLSDAPAEGKAAKPALWVCPKCKRAFKHENQSHYCGEKPKTMEEYILAQDEDKQPELFHIREVLAAALPDAEERILWGMPTYWKGYNILHFAASKKHIGFYPGAEAVEHFAKELAGYKTSKGTIQIPYGKVDDALIQAIARWCRETCAVPRGKLRD